MKTKALLIIVGMLLTTSAVAQQVYEQKDKFAGNTLYFTKLRDVKLEGGSFFTERYVMLNFKTMSPVAALVRNPFYLHAETRTNDWIFIAAGESLQLKIDGGEIVALKGMGSLDS